MSSRLTLIIQQCLSLNKNAFSRSPRKRYNSRTCKGSLARNRLKKAVGPTLSVQWLRIIHKAGSHICLLNHVHLKRRTFPLILAISPLFIFFQLSAFLPPSLMCITKRNSHYSLQNYKMPPPPLKPLINNENLIRRRFVVAQTLIQSVRKFSTKSGAAQGWDSAAGKQAECFKAVDIPQILWPWIQQVRLHHR